MKPLHPTPQQVKSLQAPPRNGRLRLCPPGSPPKAPDAHRPSPRPHLRLPHHVPHRLSSGPDVPSFLPHKSLTSPAPSGKAGVSDALVASAPGALVPVTPLTSPRPARPASRLSCAPSGTWRLLSLLQKRPSHRCPHWPLPPQLRLPLPDPCPAPPPLPLDMRQSTWRHVAVCLTDCLRVNTRPPCVRRTEPRLFVHCPRSTWTAAGPDGGLPWRRLTCPSHAGHLAAPRSCSPRCPASFHAHSSPKSRLPQLSRPHRGVPTSPHLKGHLPN